MKRQLPPHLGNWFGVTATGYPRQGARRVARAV